MYRALWGESANTHARIPISTYEPNAQLSPDVIASICERFTRTHLFLTLEIFI
jgi:hypothetical protein